MTPLKFLRAIWPEQGYYCLAVHTDRGMRHFWYESIEDAAEKVVAFDARGDTVYHACATFKTKENRKADNASHVRSVWLDLDVGDEPTKFASKIEAATQLKGFVETLKLPPPLVVDSGGGLHVYWPFEDEQPVEIVRGVARIIKRLAAHYEFKIDQSRTGDMSSILRPVGTMNRKYTPPRDVVAVNAMKPLLFEALKEAIDKAGAVLPSAKRDKKDSANADFLVPVTYPPSDANLVADRCGQMRAVRETQGNVSEPVWYSALEVLHHCEGGDAIAHEWSKGHPQYSEQQTDAKIAQIAHLGPTTCDTFIGRNPKGCDGCPYKGKITSPIQLGTRFDPIEEPPAPRNTTQHAEQLQQHEDVAGIRHTHNGSEHGGVAFIPPPKPFARTKQGITHTNEDGIATIIYPYDLVVDEIAFDDAAGHEVCSIRHYLPQEGWLDFSFRSALVASDKDFEQAMRDNHVKPVSTRLLRAYVIAYMMEVQKAIKLRRLYASMGWKNETEYFVLGTTAYHRDGTTSAVGVSPSIKAIAEGIDVRGTLEAWCEATRILDGPGMEAHAIIFAAGAGAPLMRLTGFEGALFNAVGRSNAGKTSMARFFLSMYGDFNRLKLKQRDTENAKIQRIGVLGSLPVYVDEITNEDPKIVSDFIYEITQGRSKLRLRQDGTERSTHEWHTIVVSSSNTPLTGKLGVAKSNPEAERLRLFEFRVERQDAFNDAVATQLFRVCSENYGHAGQRYIEHIVRNQESVRRGLDEFTRQLKAACKARAEERMWMAALACMLYGLKVMHDLGLVRFDVKRVVQWAINTVRALRIEIDKDRFDPIDTLGMYLNENASNRISVKEVGGQQFGQGKNYVVERYPTGEVHMRYDITRHKLWIDRRHFQKYLAEHYEDYKIVTDFLITQEILLRMTRKTLGAGTGLGTTSVECLEIDMAAPILGNVTVQVVEDDVDFEKRRVDDFDRKARERMLQRAERENKRAT